MGGRKIVVTPSAHNYQLLIKNLLSTPVIYYPDQEIVYGESFRYTYLDFAPANGKAAVEMPVTTAGVPSLIEMHATVSALSEFEE